MCSWGQGRWGTTCQSAHTCALHLAPPAPSWASEVARDGQRQGQRERQKKDDKNLQKPAGARVRETQASGQLGPGCSDKQGPRGLALEVTPDCPLLREAPGHAKGLPGPQPHFTSNLQSSFWCRWPHPTSLPPTLFHHKTWRSPPDSLFPKPTSFIGPSSWKSLLHQPSLPASYHYPRSPDQMSPLP